MKKTNIAIITVLLLGLILAVSISFLGVTLVTVNVFGANMTNDTTLARVYVWNTEPTLYNVNVYPNPVDLTPGNTTRVNCTGYVWDYNGWGDIRAMNATLFHWDYAIANDSDDNNTHYTSRNCSCAYTSSTNATCACVFNVLYYAYNGTWVCNMTITDLGGNATPGRKINFTSWNISNTTINPMMAIDAPDVLDYGNLSVTETSNLTPLNLTNWGNVAINVSVRGYAGTNESWNDTGNYSMFCDLGKIHREYERYSLNNSADFIDMISITNISTRIHPLALMIRTNDTTYGYGVDRNTTYWRINIPLGVGGSCNGTLEFQATDIT
jgi:hypothetical protein